MKSKIIVTFFLCVSLCGCTNSNVRYTLESQGYKSINLTGYRFFGCGKDDNFHTGFTAITANGSKVSGVVCEGLFKGKTIRLD